MRRVQNRITIVVVQQFIQDTRVVSLIEFHKILCRNQVTTNAIFETLLLVT